MKVLVSLRELICAVSEEVDKLQTISEIKMGDESYLSDSRLLDAYITDLQKLRSLCLVVQERIIQYGPRFN